MKQFETDALQVEDMIELLKKIDPHRELHIKTKTALGEYKEAPVYTITGVSETTNGVDSFILDFN